MLSMTYAEARDMEACGHFSFIAYGAQITMLVKYGFRYPLPTSCINHGESGVHLDAWVPLF